MLRKFVLPVLFLGLAFVLFSCGSSASPWLSSYADGFAIASPTATSSYSSVLRDGTAPLDGSEPLSEKIAAVEAIAKGTATDGCNITLPNLNGFNARANCYGPGVNYTNHPDDSGNSGSLPTGDLGIWEATQDSAACAAAQMNTLIKATSIYIDTALMLEASSICSLTAAGTAIPGVGASATDFTASFETSLKVKNPSATVTLASVTQVEAGVYQFDFEGTTDGTKAFDISFRIKKDSETSYQGRIYGYFVTVNKDAFSATFKRNGSDLNVRMLAGSWNSGASHSTVFDTNGDLKLDGSWNGNMNQAIMSMNADTGIGNVSYAWQAGAGDDKSRVFNVYTAASGSDITGCGYFGYGNSFSSTYSSNTNAITGFICHWAGPGADHSMTGTTGKAQKQCFTKNTAGVFEEITAKRAITYAPSVSCDDGSAFTYDWPTHSGDGATNNLITLSSDTDFPSYSAPTAPTLDSGI